MSSHFVHSTGSAGGGTTQLHKQTELHFQSSLKCCAQKEGQQLRAVLTRRVRVTQGEVQLRKCHFALLHK